MSLDKILTIIISIFALMISIITYYKANAISNANLELNIYNIIRNSKLSLYEASKLLIEQEDSKSNRYILTQKLYESLVEDLVSSYEEACTKYLDKKVDTKRFEKNFKRDIQRLMEDEEVVKIVGLNKISAKREYGALKEVYKKWYNKETGSF